MVDRVRSISTPPTITRAHISLISQSSSGAVNVAVRALVDSASLLIDSTRDIVEKYAQGCLKYLFYRLCVSCEYTLSYTKICKTPITYLLRRTSNTEAMEKLNATMTAIAQNSVSLIENMASSVSGEDKGDEITSNYQAIATDVSGLLQAAKLGDTGEQLYEKVRRCER